LQDEKRASASALAALSSVVAMLGCCVPLPAILLAGSLAGAGGFLAEARPYLLALSMALVAYAFYALYRKPTCAAPRPWWAQALVWLSLACVVALASFPQWAANKLAGPTENTTKTTLPVRTLADLAQLRTAFNAAVNETRVIALLSPT